MRALLFFFCVLGLSKTWATDQQYEIFGASSAPPCESEVIEDLRQLKLRIAAGKIQRSEVSSQFRNLYQRCPAPGVLLWAPTLLTNPVNGTLMFPDEILAELGVGTRIISNGLVARSVGRKIQPHSKLLLSPFRRLFMSIFFSEDATHTFLGIHDGHYVFATNNHVFSKNAYGAVAPPSRT